jgi:hypothetical protein
VLLLGSLAACGEPLVDGDDPLGPFFVISGPLDADLVLDTPATRAAVAWAFVVDGTLGGVVEEAPLEPRFLAYALTVEAPPDPADATVTLPAPPALDVPGVSVLIGLPLLYASDSDEPVALALDPGGLVDWATGDAGSVRDLVAGDGATVLATTGDHLVLGLGAEPGIERLSEVPSWDAGGDACRLDAMVAGLTLYLDEGVGCGGWRALAEAGERTEFQGVPMGPP